MSDKVDDGKGNLDSKKKKKEGISKKEITRTAQNENSDTIFPHNNASLLIRHHIHMFSTIVNEVEDNLESSINDSNIPISNSMNTTNIKQHTSLGNPPLNNIDTTTDTQNPSSNLSIINSQQDEILVTPEKDVLSKENNIREDEDSTTRNEPKYVNYFRAINPPNKNITSKINNCQITRSSDDKEDNISSQNIKAIAALNSMIAMEYANNELPITMAGYVPKNCSEPQNIENLNCNENKEHRNSASLSDRVSASGEEDDTYSEGEGRLPDSLIRLMYHRELSATRVGMILSSLDSPTCIPPNAELNPSTGEPLPQKKVCKVNHRAPMNENKTTLSSNENYFKNVSSSSSYQYYHYPMKLGPNTQYSFSKNCKINLDDIKHPDEEKAVFEILIVDGRGVAREKFKVIYGSLPFVTICLGPTKPYNPFQRQTIDCETGERIYTASADDSMNSGEVSITIDKEQNVNLKKACNCICRFRCPIYDTTMESEDYFYFSERSNVRIFNKDRFDKILPGVIEIAKLNKWNISNLRKYATVTLSFVDSREPDCKEISRTGVDKDSLPCTHKGSYMQLTVLPILDILKQKLEDIIPSNEEVNEKKD
uniref:SET domain-containing protein n=1 Tax=Parastrongyloides trichosuri TaxID=131310 RepID=A0A0N4ZB17_PARTI